MRQIIRQRSIDSSLSLINESIKRSSMSYALLEEAPSNYPDSPDPFDNKEDPWNDRGNPSAKTANSKSAAGDTKVPDPIRSAFRTIDDLSLPNSKDLKAANRTVGKYTQTLISDDADDREEILLAARWHLGLAALLLKVKQISDDVDDNDKNKTFQEILGGAGELKGFVNKFFNLKKPLATESHQVNAKSPIHEVNILNWLGRAISGSMKMTGKMKNFFQPGGETLNLLYSFIGDSKPDDLAKLNFNKVDSGVIKPIKALVKTYQTNSVESEASDKEQKSEKTPQKNTSSDLPKVVDANVEFATTIAKILNASDVDRSVVQTVILAMSNKQKEFEKSFNDLTQPQRRFIADIVKNYDKDANAADTVAMTRTPIGDISNNAEEDYAVIDTLPLNVFRLIRKHGGPKAPKVIDNKIANDDQLKSALQLAGKRINGSPLHESGQWINFLFEEASGNNDISDYAIKALKLGPSELGIGNEIDDAEAKEIASRIVTIGKEKKRFKELESEIGSLKNAPKPSGSDTANEREGNVSDDNVKQKLSDILFAPIDSNNPRKGFKVKKDDDPQSKTSSIKRNLNNLTLTMQNIDPAGNMDKAKNINSAMRRDLKTYLGRLLNDLEGVKIESKFNENDIILENWQRLAGIIK